MRTLTYLKPLLWRLGIGLLLLQIARVLFYVFNLSSFRHTGFLPFLDGLRFDLPTLVFLNAPFIVLSLLPNPYRGHSLYQKILALFFIIPNGLGLLANLTDTAYFPFSRKRATAAMLKVASIGDDTFRLLPRFLSDYWYLLTLYIALVVVMVILYRKSTISYPKKKYSFRQAGVESMVFVILSGVFLVMARGGFQLRPIDVYNAADRCGPENMPLVLNTPFVIIKTWNSLQLEEKTYFSRERLTGLYTTHRHYNAGKRFDHKPNVVILILESFSSEFIGYLSGKKSYTPFLDSLLAQSWTFDYSFANGKKSIEAIPSVLASIPALMDDAYITSAYSSNKIGSLANILKPEGYHTSFFHGATNGSMGFEGFSRIAGFDTYFGRTEYGDERDFDGHWGIWDEPFLQRWAGFLEQEQQPFLSTLFTLTSHHPFHIPDAYRQRFQGGPQPITKCIQYTDYSLRRFFDRIKKASWYPNTLFVITADHTFSSEDPYYGNSAGQYAIPIAFYTPDGALTKRDSGTVQQIDILPTVLQLIGYNRPFEAFGQSANTPHSMAIQYRNSVYQMMQDGYFLQMVHDRPKALYYLPGDSLLKKNILPLHPDKTREMSARLKAFIQTFHHHLIHNNSYE